MMLLVAKSNYRNEAVLLGFSDLRRLKTERPLVLTAAKAFSSSTITARTISRRFLLLLRGARIQ